MNRKKIRKTLTFADVLLLPAYSEVLPNEVDLKSRFTRNVSLNVPFASAAMDTVTEYRLAIALARAGGIGILHKNMSVDKQIEQINLVKRSQGGFITDPITIGPNKTMKDARKLLNKYGFTSIPVVKKNGKLKGMLFKDNFTFDKNRKNISDVMIHASDLVTIFDDATIKEAKKKIMQKRLQKLPVIDKHNRLIALVTLKDIEKSREYPHANLDKHERLRVGVAIGVNTSFSDIEKLIESEVDVAVLDTAHGHSHGVLKRCKKIKKRYPELELIGGNVATRDGAIALADVGVDGVKVGVGPGSICTTRIVAGIGVPQLTAILNASTGLRKGNYDTTIIGDGGIVQTGDIGKAIAAGADCIMAGSLFAGTEEAPGETIIFQGRKYKSYRGMGSLGAMRKGSKDRYFQDNEEDSTKLVPEGIEGIKPYKGFVHEVMHQYLGGLRATMGYVGAPNINALKKSEIIQISSASLHESHPHDVTITKAAPNYTK